LRDKPLRRRQRRNHRPRHHRRPNIQPRHRGLPAAQLLNPISEWLRAETDAGRIADDHRRSPDQLTARIRAVVTQAADSAEELAAALAAVHNLTATLHTAEPAAPPGH
jgi:hypothetical protein